MREFPECLPDEHTSKKCNKKSGILYRVPPFLRNIVVNINNFLKSRDMKNLLSLLLPPLLALWPAATYAQRDSLPERVLGEAQVTVERQLMVVKNDTVIYDPRAAGVGENDMLEQLLRALPGIFITDDGRIFLNGERVTQLLVNGRDLFKGNRNLAFENLPVYAMEKLKVYRKEADWAHLENKENKDTNRNKLVLDVRLKREYSQGWLANFELAGGADIHHGDRKSVV